MKDTLTYDICKSLKEAGFPFRTTDFGPLSGPIPKAFFLDGIDAGIGYLPPTLEELIDAMKGRIIKLLILADGRAGIQLEGQSMGDVVYCPSLISAAANLYLILHSTRI